MATPKEKFAEALFTLKELQDKGSAGFYTDEIPNRSQREILLKNGFIKEVSKGWYVSADPSEAPGDTTSWYSCYWEFCAKFIRHKYGENWCLSADQSVMIHAGNWTVPTQLQLRSPSGNNSSITLPHNTSLFNYRAELPADEIVTNINGLRLYSLQGALIYSSEGTYRAKPLDCRVGLASISDASELLPILLDNSHSTISGRLAGAFRNIGRDRIADQIIDTMKQAGYDVREEDPFQKKLQVVISPRERSPFVNRIRMMWQQMTEVILKDFPKAPGISADQETYIKTVEEVYLTDAYHSLSIERYRVTPELIAKVSSGEWDKDSYQEDRKQKDAMAARGYFQAFQEVKKSLEKILKGENAGLQADKDHQKWYRELFDPSVQAGILKASDLAGYRSHQVYISSSKHVPLSVEAMRDAMPELFDLLQKEQHPAVRAVLGHYIFVFIHPYMDGNGRIGRFLMNTMLASGGYPWTVIPVEKRDEYMKSLETASVTGDIGPFSKFIAYLVSENMKGKPVAHLPEK